MAASPIRTCIGCGERKAQGALFRLALQQGGVVAVDAARRLPGRGGYICGPQCVEAAVKRKSFGRAFRGKARLDPAALKTSLEEALAGRQLTLTSAEGKN